MTGRAAGEETFVTDSEAKGFMKNRVKRGWLRIRIKNPIEVTREVVEKPREFAERRVGMYDESEECNLNV